MILSMTGYGRGEAKSGSLTVVAEVRSVNNRFLEVSVRMPRIFATREQLLKDLTRKYLSRGKINITVTLDDGDSVAIPIKVNKAAAKSYYRLLTDLRRTLKLREAVKMEHLLNFSDIFDADTDEGIEEERWEVVVAAVNGALEQLQEMRRNEGQELGADMAERIDRIASIVDAVELKSKDRIPQERERLRDRVKQILQAGEVDENRLELELVLLSEKLDVTEECVRLRSHLKFFMESVSSPDPGGRKLNFLVQEILREINTIGSKASDAEITRMVISGKEEVEKIREQLQNIE